MIKKRPFEPSEPQFGEMNGGMQQGGLQAQTEKRITELKKLTHELEIHGCGQENAIYDLAAEMADVEGSIQKELDHFRNMFDEARHRTVENNKRVIMSIQYTVFT